MEEIIIKRKMKIYAKNAKLVLDIKRLSPSRSSQIKSHENWFNYTRIKIT